MGGSRRGAVAAVLICGGAAVGAVVGYAGLHEVGRTATSATQAPSRLLQEAIDVHVGGWVASPGVVRVREGSIVADAVAAAGGALAGALVDQINLAAELRDGDQVIVPGPGSDDIVEPGDGPPSVNRSDSVTLQQIPGVGPVLADRIVAFREEHGPFERVEDLLEVPGIGEAKLAAMRDHIRVP